MVRIIASIVAHLPTPSPSPGIIYFVVIYGGRGGLRLDSVLTFPWTALSLANFVIWITSPSEPWVEVVLPCVLLHKRTSPTLMIIGVVSSVQCCPLRVAG